MALGIGAVGLGFWLIRAEHDAELPGPPRPVAAARPQQPAPDQQSGLLSKLLKHPAPYIPAPCYTKTRDDQGRVHNPCFTCHQASRAPNYISDDDIQLGYTFATLARENPWRNAFVDRSSAQLEPDAETLAYVRESNYEKAGRQLLLDALTQLPATWDFDGDGRWGGYLPDAGFSFDAEGFDHGPHGDFTGWRAFGYQPFPGTFWPTNGSAGDVLIRLPAEFREDESGHFDLDIYRINLAVVESLIARRDVAIRSTDEAALGVDLDRDGRLATARRVTFDWAPLHGRLMGYVGRAKLVQKNLGHVPAAGLFPRGTEFLHSVRYLDVQEGHVTMAARMKELRYARKNSYRNYEQLESAAAKEGKEKQLSPDNLRQVRGDLERGVENTQGWIYQGFIEDAAGALRPQTYEESVFCVGCHGGVGATSDGIFSFARKLWDGVPSDGWFHWSQRDLVGLPDQRRADGQFEYEHYLEQNGAGDELRENSEVLARFFDPRGAVRPEAIARLRRDISSLLLPSPSRALALNKAYRALVREQHFEDGRDALLGPARQIHERVSEDQATGIEQAITGPR